MEQLHYLVKHLNPYTCHVKLSKVDFFSLFVFRYLILMFHLNSLVQTIRKKYQDLFSLKPRETSHIRHAVTLTPYICFKKTDFEKIQQTTTKS